jgi:hypothetical protein
MAMSFRVFGILVLCCSALGGPCFAQATRALTPVAPQELNRFIGAAVYGRARAKIGIVTGANRERGTIKVIAWQGEVATIPVSLLGRAGLQLRAPAVTLGDVARASYAGASRVPLRGEVTVTEDQVRPSSIE